MRGEPPLDDLVAQLLPSFPTLDAEKQTVSIKILQLLAGGNPVSHQQLADSLQLPIEAIIEILGRWWGVYYDEQGRITGYWGLTVSPTQHRVQLNGRTLYTWCAWDTLFLPALLHRTVQVESRCAQTNNRVQLTLGPEGPQNIQPADAVMSFLVPKSHDVKDDIVAHFCHFVYFFESVDAGLAWTKQRPDTFLLSIDDAYKLGKMINASLYPDIRH